MIRIEDVNVGDTIWFDTERYLVTDKGTRTLVATPWHPADDAKPFPPYRGGEVVIDEYAMEVAEMKEPERL